MLKILCSKALSGAHLAIGRGDLVQDFPTWAFEYQAQ